jgi:putative transposase
MGEKKVQGRKRHTLVDTMGDLMRVVVHRADRADRDGAYYVFEDIKEAHPKLEKVWADQAYTGDLAADLLEKYNIILEIVEKVPGQQGFVVLPRRWVVERSFAWLGWYRRLSKDYEHRVEYSETWVYIASISRMLRKLHPNRNEEQPYIRKKKSPSQDKISALCA